MKIEEETLNKYRRLKKELFLPRTKEMQEKLEEALSKIW